MLEAKDANSLKSLLLKVNKCTSYCPALNSSKSLLDELHLSINLHAGKEAKRLFKDECHHTLVKSISFLYVTLSPSSKASLFFECIMLLFLCISPYSCIYLIYNTEGCFSKRLTVISRYIFRNSIFQGKHRRHPLLLIVFYVPLI